MSPMTKSVEQWARLADYRMRSAAVLHESGQHLDAVFHLQQAIEYLLKGLLQNQGLQPLPKSHDLLELLGLWKQKVPEAQRKIIDELHDISVPLRYPDDLDEAIQAYTYEEVKRISEETQTLLKWLKQELN
jgi:HEPN domain-containing protein